MPCKVDPPAVKGVGLSCMENGELAVIVSWPGWPQRVGQVVQRYQNAMVILGTRSGQCFPTLIGSNPESCRVRILEPGESITIENYEL